MLPLHSHKVRITVVSIITVIIRVAWWRNAQDVGLMIMRSWVLLAVGSLLSGYTMGDCLETGKPPWYIINIKLNLVFHFSKVGWVLSVRSLCGR